MTPILMRPASPQDAEGIADVHLAARREAMPYLPEIHSDDETRAWVAQVVLPTQTVWIMESGERVVGVAALDGDMLEQLYVRPGEQGRGVGSQLLAKVKL
ncbi:MAG: GNAT family N-acetyltransferase, partial [Chloroflexota bacterium]|nr:GNAT family N-acetyltransferase [Chloroflexota bacterium]